MRRLVRWVVGIIVLLIIAGIAGFLFVRSGLYNVSAMYPDNPRIASIMDATMTHSVQRHSAGITVPPLNDPKMAALGAEHYHEMCVGCHGAPGVPIGEIGKGLNPAPPELVESAGDWKPNELFWLTKSGVRMTGMPAWGTTHSDSEIWNIVAFLQRLPKLSPAQYRSLIEKAPAMRENMSMH